MSEITKQLMPEDLIITKGEIFKDSWSTSEIAFSVPYSLSSSKIEILIWNPNFNMAYMNNMISIKKNGSVVSSSHFKAGETKTISIFLDSTKGEDLFAVSSQAFLLPDPYDERQRSYVIRVYAEG